MKHLFIINPAAGKGRTRELIPKINALFSNIPDVHQIEITEKPGHGSEIARRYSGEGECRIYSVGGDGTLNEVLNGMIGSRSSLAIIPCGSGNDFVRSLHMEGYYEGLLEDLVHGRECLLDAARVNDRYFINISSVGFDAEVAWNARNYKRLPGISGSLAYVLGILTAVFRYGGSELHIEVDGRRMTQKCLLSAIANGRYYGGGMLPVPHAQIDDGQLEVCLIQPVSKIKILALFPRLMKGTHVGMREVSFHSGRKITISSEEELSLNIDGEITRSKSMVFEIAPQAIRIVIPQKNYDNGIKLRY